MDKILQFFLKKGSKNTAVLKKLIITDQYTNFPSLP